MDGENCFNLCAFLDRVGKVILMPIKLENNSRYDRKHFPGWLLFTAYIRTHLLSAKHFENWLLIGQVD
jgi:hypothetical protein